jgi:hypothetical protein
MSSSVRLRFTSRTHLGLYVDEIRHTLDWGFEGSFGHHAGDGIIVVKREGTVFARLPFTIRGYGSIIVLEVVIPDTESRSEEYVRAKLKEITTRVYTI